MGNPIYYPPSPVPACTDGAAPPPRRDLTAEVAGALADADVYFGRAFGGVPLNARDGVNEGAAPPHPSTSTGAVTGWGVGYRWGLPPLPAVLRPHAAAAAAFPGGGEEAASASFAGLLLQYPPPHDHPAATQGRTASSAARSLDRLRRELMLSALDPSDWDAAFGGGGGGGAGAGGPPRRALRPPPPPPREGDLTHHPSALATALLRASAGDAAARVLEVQATLAALEGRVSMLQAARRARAAATAAAGRMV